jgi:LysM domain
MPALMVVPTGSSPGALRDLGRMPIMYAPPIPMAGPRSFTHTVKAGDTLPGIARRYRVSVEDLRRWNNIGRLTVGQKLTIQAKAAPAKAKQAKGKSKQASPGRTIRKTTG